MIDTELNINQETVKITVSVKGTRINVNGVPGGNVRVTAHIDVCGELCIGVGCQGAVVDAFCKFRKGGGVCDLDNVGLSVRRGVGSVIVLFLGGCGNVGKIVALARGGCGRCGGGRGVLSGLFVAAGCQKQSRKHEDDGKHDCYNSFHDCFLSRFYLVRNGADYAHRC